VRAQKAREIKIERGGDRDRKTEGDREKIERQTEGDREKIERQTEGDREKIERQTEGQTERQSGMERKINKQSERDR